MPPDDGHSMMTLPDEADRERAEEHIDNLLLPARRLLRQHAPVREILKAIKEHVSPLDWASWHVQKCIHRMLLSDPVQDIFPLAPQYRATFIRRLCDELEEAVRRNEEGEVIEPIFRELNVLLNQPARSIAPGEGATHYVTFECPVCKPVHSSFIAHDGLEIPSFQKIKHVNNRDGRQQDEKESNTRILAIRMAPKENAVGLKLWEACYILSETLLRNPELCHGRDVVELGAGVGLLGLVAAYCAGAAHVTLTDVDDKVLHFLRANVEANVTTGALATLASNGHLAPRKAEVLVPSIDVAPLDWTRSREAEALFDTGVRRKGDLGMRSRTVLAADCVYDRDLIPAFVDTLAFALRALPPPHQTLVLVASTLRNPATFACFQGLVATKGLVMEDVTDSLADRNGIASPFYCPNRAAVRLTRISLPSGSERVHE